MVLTISLCMIVKNEAAVLGRLLDCVDGIFDEIVIADTGSTDATPRIAASHGAAVFSVPWTDDFSAARNASLEKATGDYLFWLDADDVIDEENRKKLLALKENLPPETDMVMLPYAAAFDGAGRPSFVYYRERLFRNHAGFRFRGFVHECVEPRGKVIGGDAMIFHKPPENKKKDPRRNLALYEKHLSRGGRFTAREQYYYGRELYDNGENDRAVFALTAFLGRRDGDGADKAGAARLLYALYKDVDREKALVFLASALVYDAVSPEILCLLGDERQKDGAIDEAVFWYEAAAGCPARTGFTGFTVSGYADYYPLMQLVVCYERLGLREKALVCHERAKALRPESAEVQFNEAYFAGDGEKADTGEAEGGTGEG